MWIGPDWSPGAPELTPIQRTQLAESDVITFHNYEWPENFEASLQLSEALLVDIGVPMGPVIASIHERREEFRRALKRENVDQRREVPPFHARRSAHKGP